MIEGDPKYSNDSGGDMKIPACFESAHSRLYLVLESAKSEIGPNNERIRVPGTGAKAIFEGGHLLVKSSALVKILLAHPLFMDANKGFWPDQQDPSGFWLEAGYVTEKQVTVYERVPAGDVPDLKKLNPKKIAETLLAKQKEAEGANGE